MNPHTPVSMHESLFLLWDFQVTDCSAKTQFLLFAYELLQILHICDMHGFETVSLTCSSGNWDQYLQAHLASFWYLTLLRPQKSISCETMLAEVLRVMSCVSVQ